MTKFAHHKPPAPHLSAPVENYISSEKQICWKSENEEFAARVLIKDQEMPAGPRRQPCQVAFAISTIFNILSQKTQELERQVRIQQGIAKSGP